jgi:hypothetical protein
MDVAIDRIEPGLDTVETGFDAVETLVHGGEPDFGDRCRASMRVPSSSKPLRMQAIISVDTTPQIVVRMPNMAHV